MSDAQSIPAAHDRAQGPSSWVRRQRSPAGRQLVHAAIVADANVTHAPGALLLEEGAVLACGTPEGLGAPAPGTTHQKLPGSLVCPPLVNAHVHLDLSSCEAPEFTGNFETWLRAIRDHRIEQAGEEGSVTRSVMRGALESLEGGCAYVGDISGSPAALDALRDTPLSGRGYLEFMGHGERSDAAAKRIDQSVHADQGHDRVALGISPHAPMSTGRSAYEAATASGLPVATHLAESLEELAWCQDGSGPFADLLELVGYVPGSVESLGAHPVEAIVPLLPAGRTMVVHLNYVGTEHVEMLAANGMTVGYCPRASRYFGHPHAGAAPHRWREMIAHGVPVALGTDGRPCLSGPGVRARRLSVLDDAITLVEEDGAQLEQWLAMATIHGARAIGLDPAEVTLGPGRKRGLLDIPLRDPGSSTQLARDAEVSWLFFDADAPVGWQQSSAST